MGYSLSAEEVKKREKYVAKVHDLHERFKKFGVDYLSGDRSGFLETKKIKKSVDW